MVRSLDVMLRGPSGLAVGLLAVKLDISGMVQAQHTLASITSLYRLGQGQRSFLDPAGDDIRSVIDAMVGAILAEMGKTPAMMTREEKMSVVKRLDERGAFLVKRSAEQVAQALDLSRYTVFSYLKEIRHDAGRPDVEV